MDSFDIDEFELPIGGTIARLGQQANTVLQVAHDPMHNGFLAYIWQCPPDEDTPVGTVRPFATVREAVAWLLECDTLNASL